jgi:hypothetical protein
VERCKGKGKSQFWVFTLTNFQQLTLEFVASCEMGRGDLNTIPWLLDIREEFRHVNVLEGSANASKVSE